MINSILDKLIRFSKHELALRIYVDIALAILSLIILAIFFQGGRVNSNPRANVDDMITGKAYRPFVTRALLPLTVKMISSVCPHEMKGTAKNIAASTNKFYNTLGRKQVDLDHSFEYFTAFFLIFFSLWGFLISIKSLFSALYDSSKVLAHTIPLIALIILPGFINYTTYLYDFPALFLFTLAFVFMVRRKWIAYLLVFILGCINKETAILLTILFFLQFRKDQKLGAKGFVLLLSLQILCWVGIRWWLSVLYAGNPGMNWEFHFVDHNMLEIPPYPLSTALSWGAILFLTIYKWAEKPLPMKRGALLFIPLFVLSIFWGFMDETRIFYEVYAPFFMLGIFSVVKMLGVEIKTREA